MAIEKTAAYEAKKAPAQNVPALAEKTGLFDERPAFNTRTQTEYAPPADAGHRLNRINISPAPAGMLQTKSLDVGEPGDRYERQADRVASQVVGGAPSHNGGGVSVSGAAASGSSVNLALPEHGGKALNKNTRADMESGFGHSFADVRVHDNGASHKTAESIGARAFTVGSNIYFGKGEYNDSSSQGRNVLAHELTHVVQQGQMGGEMIQMQPKNEQEARKRLIEIAEQLKAEGNRQDASILKHILNQNKVDFNHMTKLIIQYEGKLKNAKNPSSVNPETKKKQNYGNKDKGLNFLKWQLGLNLEQLGPQKQWPDIQIFQFINQTDQTTALRNISATQIENTGIQRERLNVQKQQRNLQQGQLDVQKQQRNLQQGQLDVQKQQLAAQERMAGAQEIQAELAKKQIEQIEKKEKLAEEAEKAKELEEKKRKDAREAAKKDREAVREEWINADVNVIKAKENRDRAEKVYEDALQEKEAYDQLASWNRLAGDDAKAYEAEENFEAAKKELETAKKNAAAPESNVIKSFNENWNRCKDNITKAFGNELASNEMFADHFFGETESITDKIRDNFKKLSVQEKSAIYKIIAEEHQKELNTLPQIDVNQPQLFGDPAKLFTDTGNAEIWAIIFCQYLEEYGDDHDLADRIIKPYIKNYFLPGIKFKAKRAQIVRSRELDEASWEKAFKRTSIRKKGGLSEQIKRALEGKQPEGQRALTFTTHEEDTEKKEGISTAELTKEIRTIERIRARII
ncbi:DUF4157 [Desulfonema magnum]|uniref:DUF4157 n=2 Tax=Desulfonema magnum TaxID=45655 RepID=A0A975GPR3_9BACT|nr:DUF4157 [Desulfonema magnum]